jgi:hypothetical protein
MPRRRGFALFRSLIDDDADVAYDLERFWRGLISRFGDRHPRHDVLGQTGRLHGRL